MTIISAFNKPKITPQILDKKYLKKFKKHSNYESYINGEATLPNVSYCTDNDEVHYNPGPYNGHAYVDLGLPSGTKWATMNVGANSETDAGLYFAWGETKGYADASTKAFSWNDYKFNPNGDGSTFTKYNTTDGKTVLDLEDDAAHVNMGGNWHMPTQEQCVELFKETKNGFVTNTGVFTQYAWDDTEGYSSPTETIATISGWDTAGYFFFKNTYTSVTDAISANDYLFIPAVSFMDYLGSAVKLYGIHGGFWTSAISSETDAGAMPFIFSGTYKLTDTSSPITRYAGLSIRGVIG